MDIVLTDILQTLPIPPGFPTPSPILDLPVLPTPNLGPSPAQIAEAEFIGQVIGFVVLIVGFAIWGIVKKARQSAARRFYAQNPDASLVYSIARWPGGRREVLEIKKIDGKRPHSSAQGVYVLPGRRDLEVQRKRYLSKRVEKEELPPIIMDIGRGKRYLLAMDDATRCKLVEVNESELYREELV